MPKRYIYKKDDQQSDEEEWDPVKILKSLSLEDFLKCEDTRQILINENNDKI